MYRQAVILLFIAATALAADPPDINAHVVLPDLKLHPSLKDSNVNVQAPLLDSGTQAELPNSGAQAPTAIPDAGEEMSDSGDEEPLPDLGAPNWKCDPAVMAKSKEVPKSVHSVRFADIKVVAALGDSQSAGNGANSSKLTSLRTEYRGLAFAIGGDTTLDEHITIPNILRKFNPDLFGYSNGAGVWNEWNVSRLNMAVPGSEAKDMIVQAQRLVEVLRTRPEVNITDDWKLVHIFVGGNDVCQYCHDWRKGRKSAHGPDTYKANLVKAIQYLKDNLPRTIVSLTGMINIEVLRPVDKHNLVCKGLHFFYECNCEFQKRKTRKVCFDYMEVQREIQDQGIFDSSDDFAFVIQPFTYGIERPPLTDEGRPDLRFFAPDCFHFSKFGHSNFAKHLWNNMVQRVGAKSTSVELSNVNSPLLCPPKNCPLFPTKKNSRNCKKYLTPSKLDV
ncbi:hypothetical protein V3C99_010685 [Haemonchus contortus]